MHELISLADYLKGWIPRTPEMVERMFLLPERVLRRGDRLELVLTETALTLHRARVLERFPLARLHPSPDNLQMRLELSWSKAPWFSAKHAKERKGRAPAPAGCTRSCCFDHTQGFDGVPFSEAKDFKGAVLTHCIGCASPNTLVLHTSHSVQTFNHGDDVCHLVDAEYRCQDCGLYSQWLRSFRG